VQIKDILTDVSPKIPPRHLQTHAIKQLSPNCFSAWRLWNLC